MYNFYEFFAGGGMARAGLGEHWHCLFANDFDKSKAAIYSKNWGEETLSIRDVRDVRTSDLPGLADLAWASFPCQDLSLAGGYVGLKGERSGTFWPFWELMQALALEERSPRCVVLENVYGAITSHEGRDFAAICSTLAEDGYHCGALVIDAIHFVPQSRPRLFIVGVRTDIDIPKSLIAEGPSALWHPAALIGAYQHLSPKAKKRWVWWALPQPASRTATLKDLIEGHPQGVGWHTPQETDYLLSLMSDVNRRKVEEAKRSGKLIVGTVYRRTRRDSLGKGHQRAEVRFDNVSGCLRTPSGGSSRQTILIVKGSDVRSRLLSPREAARLMGLPDSYKLPSKYNEAYHLAGDGVVVPVVSHIARNLLETTLESSSEPKILIEKAS